MHKLFLLVLLILLAKFRAATVSLNWNRQVGNQGTTTINVGDTVQWTWTEAVGHTVTSQGSPSFTSSSTVSTNGYTYSVTFTSSGSYSYHCSIHNMMQGVISVVVATSSPTRSPTRTPTRTPTYLPSVAPTEATATDYPTPNPTTAPSLAPTVSYAPTTAPSSSLPTISPTTDIPTCYPSAAPTLSLIKLFENELVVPTVIDSGANVPSSWSFTLHVREHRHTNNQVTFTTRSYCYNNVCSYPGPSIRIRPGDNFTMTLVNELGPEAEMGHRHNTIHSPNTTNIHTHGLHIDPNVDTVFVKAGPSESLTYKYHLPADHAPGLHWYHAHYHGSSALQLMGGLVGALIVEPDVGSAQNIPVSLTNADARILVISKLILAQETSDGEVSQGCGLGWTCDPDSQGPLCTGTETESPYNAFRLYSLQELSAAAGSTMDINPVLQDPDETDLDLVNGMFRPVIRMVKDSPSIFRIVHAAGGGPLVLTPSNSAVCNMTVLAWDGVYLTARLPQDEVRMVAASRVEIEVTCSEVGLFSINNNYKSVIFYMYVNSTGEVKAAVSDEDLGGIVRPWYLQDLTDSSLQVDSEYSVFISQEGMNQSVCGFWMGAGANCSAVHPMGDLTPSTSYQSCPFGQFAGSRGRNYLNYKSAGKLVTYVGAVNEWTLYGLGSAFHPLHVHVNHMQIISTSAEVSGFESYYRVGQWRDTIPPVANHVKLRFIAADFPGETVLHCHFQRHEDLGMMDTYLVMNASYYKSVYTTSPTLSPTHASTTPPTTTPTWTTSDTTTIANFEGTIQLDGTNVTRLQQRALEKAMEKKVQRGCHVSVWEGSRPNGGGGGGRRNGNINNEAMVATTAVSMRRLAVTVNFALSLVLERNLDIDESNFFSVLTAEIDTLVANGALTNATNEELRAILGGSYTPITINAIHGDPNSVSFIDGGDDNSTDDTLGDDLLVENTGDCSSKVFAQCIQNVIDNKGDYAYCDMCMCEKFESYGGSGSCGKDELLYACFISDSGCKAQLRQSWIIGFACIGLFLCCLFGVCAFMCCRKRGKNVSIVTAVSG